MVNKIKEPSITFRDSYFLGALFLFLEIEMISNYNKACVLCNNLLVNLYSQFFLLSFAIC